MLIEEVIMTKVQELFIVNLKRARSKKGYSQLRLSEAANLSLGFIGDIESGKKFPSAASMQKIIDSLGIEPFELFIDIKDSQIKCPLSKLHCVQSELIGKIDEEISQTLSRHFNPAETQTPTRKA